MKETPVTFKSKGKNLFGVLHGGREGAPAIIILHGFMGTKSTPILLTRIARFLASKGYSVLRFDFRGSGDSEGDYAKQNISTEVEDLDSAIKLVKRKTKTSQIGVIGYSRGAMVALIGASKNKSIKVVVAVGCPISTRELWNKNLLKMIFVKDYVYNLWGFKLTKELLENDFKWNLADIAKRVKQPLLLIHGSRDSTVPLRHSKLLFEVANHPKKFVLVDGSNHFFPQEKHFNTLFNSVLDWVDKYLKNHKR